MRIHIKTTSSDKIIDFDYLHLLTGVLHKWFGENNFHDSISLYSFSGLQGAVASKTGLQFKHGASFYISCWRIEDAKLLIKGIQAYPDMFYGLRVQEITLQEKPDLSDRVHFRLGSPIYIQRNIEDGTKKFYFYDDKEAGDLLKATLENKMIKAGIPLDDTLRISFDLNYAGKKTKKVEYHGKNYINKLKVSWCPVIIEGKPETKQFAWCVGLGNSTGIGLGAIK